MASNLTARGYAEHQAWKPAADDLGQFDLGEILAGQSPAGTGIVVAERTWGGPPLSAIFSDRGHSGGRGACARLPFSGGSS